MNEKPPLSIMMSYEFQSLVDVVTKRLDGHGLDIRVLTQEMKEIRKELKDVLVKAIEDIQNAREKCNERHSLAMMKIAGVSGFIAGGITIAGHFWK